MTTLFPYIRQEPPTTNSLVRQKYGLSCLFTLEGHPHKTKSITFEMIGSLFKTFPIFLDVTWAWMSSVMNMNTSFFTEEKLSFSFEGKQLKKSVLEFSEQLQYFRL